MEESRLKPMVEGYDEKLFNELHQKTKGLRIKLSKQIDHRRFGVDNLEIQSWFDVKFIYAFNKYCQSKSPDHLLAYIIQSLQFFKIRIIRAANTVQNSQKIISTEDVFFLEETEAENPWENPREELLENTLQFLKGQLSDNALLLLELQLNPPIYIQNRLTKEGIHDFNKIPNSLYAEYLELGTTRGALKLIDELKREITHSVKVAREHFLLSQLSYN